MQRRLTLTELQQKLRQWWGMFLRGTLTDRFFGLQKFGLAGYSELSGGTAVCPKGVMYMNIRYFRQNKAKSSIFRTKFSPTEPRCDYGTTPFWMLSHVASFGLDEDWLDSKWSDQPTLILEAIILLVACGESYLKSREWAIRGQGFFLCCCLKTTVSLGTRWCWLVATSLSGLSGTIRKFFSSPI